MKVFDLYEMILLEIGNMLSVSFVKYFCANFFNVLTIQKN